MPHLLGLGSGVLGRDALVHRMGVGDRMLRAEDVFGEQGWYVIREYSEGE